MKILSIDYGRKKIGLAVGDSETGLVEENKKLKAKNLPVDRAVKNYIEKIKNLCIAKGIQKVVIGITAGEIDKEIKNFGVTLERAIGLPVEFFDETLTTKEAQRILIESGRKRKKRKEKEDAIAASIMLLFYLDRPR